MKKIFITLAAALAFSVIGCQELSAQQEFKRTSFGVKTGYVTFNKTATAGIELQYAFSPHFVLAPNVDYIFRNEGLDGLLVNLDYHGPWQLDKAGRWKFYHILGVNYASWSSHEKTLPDGGSDGGNVNDDVTSRFNRIGLNFGAGIEYYVRPSLKLSLQGRFNWIKEHNAGLFNLGISYVF